MIELIFFGIVAAFVLFQLINVLGRKVGFQSEDKPVAVKSDQAEAPARLERLVEQAKIPNLDVLKTRDTQFNETLFIEKTRETYEQVVKAFHNGDLTPIKDRLSQTVYEGFDQAIKNRKEQNLTTLSFIDPPKADIDTIDVIDDKARIKVRLLAELLYEEPRKPDEAPSFEDAPKTKMNAQKAKAEEEAHNHTKTYRRTAEYWTFEKSLKLGHNPWLLQNVKAVKAWN